MANLNVPCTNSKYVLAFIAVVLFCPNSSLSSKILFYNSRGEGSHYVAAAGLGEELAVRGHAVTFLLADVYKHRTEHPVHSKLFNFKFIKTWDTLPIEFDAYLEELAKVSYEGKNFLFANHVIAASLAIDVRQCGMLFNQTDLLSSLSDEHFDLVIFDPFWPCSTGLSEYLGGKRIALIPTSLMPSMLRYMNIPINPIITPEVGMGFQSKMNFVERTNNFLYMVVGMMMLPSHNDWPYQSTLESHGISPSSSSLPKIDFVITITDPLIDKVVPMYPSHITVGGLTSAPAHPLSQDLEDFMQSSGDHGVIIFTLGSYVTHLPEYVLTAYSDAFANIPQKVVWQWKNKIPPQNVPSNVKILPWLPQQDLLGHNKTKLFIYHGGNNGLYEAIYHGVPILVMPIFFDQLDIAQNVFEKEIGMKIMLSDVSSERVSQVLDEILTNNKYRDNMKRMSSMFAERPQTPREKAAFWVEHILKYGSAHLRHVPGQELYFVQYYLIDIISFLLFCLMIILFVLYLGIKYSLKLICLLVCPSRKRKKE